MMMSGEEKNVQAPDLPAIEASCPLAGPGNGGGDNNNYGDGECRAMVALPASEEETKIVKSNKNEEYGWEAACAWLMTLPRRRNVMQNEIEVWLDHNKHNLSTEIINMPRQHLYRYLISQHKLIRRADQPQSPQQQKAIQNNGIGLSEDLKHRQMLVDGGLMQRGELSAELQHGHIDGFLRDSRNSDTERNAVQKGDLDGGEALPRNNIPAFIDGTSNELKNSDIRLEQEHGNGTMPLALTMLDSGNMLKDISEDTENLAQMGKDEALRRYELLSKLENRLMMLISNSNQQLGVSNLSNGGVSLPSRWSSKRTGFQFLEGNDGAEGRTKRRLRDSIKSQQDLASHSIVGRAKLRSSADAELGRKRKKTTDNLDISVSRWVQSEPHGDVGVEQLVGFPRNQDMPRGAEKVTLLGSIAQPVRGEGLVLEAVRERLERLTEGVPMARLDDIPLAMQSNVVGVPQSWRILLHRVATGILSTGVWSCLDVRQGDASTEPSQAP